MALFPFYRYRFFDDPFDRFFLNELDFFDPWYDFDTFPSFNPITPRLRSIKEQQRVTYSSKNISNNTKSLEMAPRAPQSDKFHVELNIDGFHPDEIKKRIEGRQLIVEAKQEHRWGEHDYTVRELRKTYELPPNADPNRLTSHITPNNMLVIEVPIHNPENERRLEQAKNNMNNQSLTQFGQYRDPLFDNAGVFNGSDLQPRIVDKGNNQKQLEMIVEMKNYRPQEINVSVKNNELIIQGEHQFNDANHSERSSFFKSTTLPPGTQIDRLESHFNDDGQLKITAPYI